MDPSLLLNNPQLNNIAPEKLQFLMDFAQNNTRKSPTEMLPIFMAASKAAQQNGINFDSQETTLIFEIMKQSMTEDEKKRADMIMNMFKRRNNK